MSSGENNENVIICVDALGADDAPGVVLRGVEQALGANSNLAVKLAGPEDCVVPFCENLGKNNPALKGRCEPLISTEEISMSEHPAKAVRKKKNSSIVLGCKAVAEGEAQGFFSGGNTGACLAAATLFTGRIKGVKRPMLMTLLPTLTPGKSTLFCDLGANADCKPDFILQFAQMAKVVLAQTTNNTNPKIGLLNIGEEDEKGTMFYQETNQLLREKLPEFVGNAQGSDLLTGEFDAVVADGFTGNVALKTLEGSIKTIFKLLKQTMMSSAKTKIGALLLKNDLKKMVKNLDPESVGAALLIGVKGAVCVGHGSSSDKAICSGILKTAEYAKTNMVTEIKKELNVEKA